MMIHNKYEPDHVSPPDIDWLAANLDIPDGMFFDKAGSESRWVICRERGTDLRDTGLLNVFVSVCPESNEFWVASYGTAWSISFPLDDVPRDAVLRVIAKLRLKLWCNDRHLPEDE